MVQIELDKSRTLFFDILATRDLEQALGGRPLGNVIADISNFSVTAILAALYVGLRHEDKALSQNLVNKLFSQYVKDKRSMRVLITAISNAIEETGLFATDEETEGNVKPEPAGVS